jgi:Flp pilus assembly protein TadG
MGRRESIVRARRGAVIAEFAIAFMPICTMFLCLVQLSRYSIARLAVLHAAQVSVRACAVIKSPDPGHSKQVDGPDTDVAQAATLAMQPFEGSGEIQHNTPTCDHDGADDGSNNGNGGTDTVKLSATYTCGIPVAKRIVCPSGTKNITTIAQFPHQGAKYWLNQSGPD